MLSKKIKLNLNFRLVVNYVLRLAKPLSENTKRNRSAKVKVTHFDKKICYVLRKVVLAFARKNNCPLTAGAMTQEWTTVGYAHGTL